MRDLSFHKPVDRPHQLFNLPCPFAFFDGGADAAVYMPTEDLDRDLIESSTRRGHLLKHIHAIPALLQHALDALDLPFDFPQPFEAVGVRRWLWHR